MQESHIRFALKDLEELYDQFSRLLSENSENMDQYKMRREIKQFEDRYSRLKGIIRREKDRMIPDWIVTYILYPIIAACFGVATAMMYLSWGCPTMLPC